MGKIALIIIIVLVITGIVITLVTKNPEDKEEEKLYQGPVEPGYDEELFRKTGRYEKLHSTKSGQE